VNGEPSARVDILPTWRHLNGMLIDLVELVPVKSLGWSPRPDLWGFRRLFVHLCDAREEWMTRAFADGERNVGYLDAQTPDEIREALRQTWDRIERTIGDQAKLDAVYRDRWWAEAPPREGHWVAFHLLEHDIHHRADVLMYLALLGVETPQVWTP
jgi:uncharacterized damage-inducible protein DinB